MFIIISLLIVLSLPKVWLKPLKDEGEFNENLEDDMTREKRQAQIFELIHRAIENYANCANQHLSPLKALADFKRYETFVLSENYNTPSGEEEIVGATSPDNKSNVKCKKINLCSVLNQTPAVTPKPLILGKSLYSDSEESFKYYTNNRKNNLGSRKLYMNQGYFPVRPIDYIKLPIYGSNRAGQKPYNKTEIKKNSHALSALNRALLHKLFNMPTTQTNTTDIILGSKFEDPKCHCSPNLTEKPETSTQNGSPISLQGSYDTTTTTSPLLGVKADNILITEKPKDCGCLTTQKPDEGPDILQESTTENDISTTKTTTSPLKIISSTNDSKHSSDPLVGSKMDKSSLPNNSDQEMKTSTIEIKSTTSVPLSVKFIENTPAHSHSQKSQSPVNKDTPLNQNLNFLVLQLDLKDQKENKDHLKEILKDIKALKSAIKIRDISAEKSETNTLIAKSKDLSKTTTITSSKSDPTVGIQRSDTAVKSSAIDFDIKNQKNLTTETGNISSLKTSKINNISVTDNSKSLDQKGLLNSTNTTLIKTIHFTNKTGNWEILNDDITAVTSSPALDLNISNSQDLERITNEVNSIVKSLNNKSLTSNLTENLDNNKSGKLTYTKLDLDNTNTALHKNEESTRNSNITISISNNGSFKKFANDQDSSDKNIELNEKEKINLGSTKVRSADMRGTGSRYINYLKTPQEKDSYSEPILHEIYPKNSKSKTKQPISLYWHKIEKKQQKPKKENPEIWKRFQSNDFENNESDNNGTKENLSSSLEKCEEYEDLFEMENSESAEINSKREKCKRSILIT